MPPEHLGESLAFARWAVVRGLGTAPIFAFGGMDRLFMLVFLRWFEPLLYGQTIYLWFSALMQRNNGKHILEY